MELVLCTPAIIYIIFSITQIILDTMKGHYNTASMKIIVMVMISILLNILCTRGLGVISWIIVFIPFIFMTLIVSLLLYFFGLNETTGTFNYTCKNNKVSTDDYGNIIIYYPNYSLMNQIHYQYPYIVIPNDTSNEISVVTMNSSVNNNSLLNYWLSSSPAYKS